LVVQRQRDTRAAASERTFAALVDVGRHQDVLGQQIAGDRGNRRRTQSRLAAELDPGQWPGPPYGVENEAAVLATHEFCVGFALHDSLSAAQDAVSIIDFQGLFDGGPTGRILAYSRSM